VADVYCDGLGACLGHCPQGAIKVIEREAEAFDESAVQAAKGMPAAVRGCPGAAMQDLRLPMLSASAATVAPPTPNTDGAPLCHWPIQLHLVPPHAPFLQGADLFLVADCVPFACADFHTKLLCGRPLVIGCPKLDDGRAYVDKLADILRQSAVKSLTVVHMEVPCCTRLMHIAIEARHRSGREAVPLAEATVSCRGAIR
jgi:hypothetical protein